MFTGSGTAATVRNQVSKLEVGVKESLGNSLRKHETDTTKAKKAQIIISRRATRTLRQSKQQLPFKGPFRNKTEDILETKQATF